MTNLSAFKNDTGIEILIDRETGESFCSVSGYARMSGKDKSVVSRRLKTVADGTRTEAEIDTATGLKTVALISEGLITDWIIDDNPAIAKQLLKAGVRVYLHTLAGFQVKSVEPEQPKSSADMFMLVAQQFKQHEQRMEILEAENVELRRKLSEVKETVEVVELETQANTVELERFKNGHGRWFSVIAYANLKSLPSLSLQQAASLGKKAASLCRIHNIKPEKLPDPRFGEVSCYPDWILDEVF